MYLLYKQFRKYWALMSVFLMNLLSNVLNGIIKISLQSQVNSSRTSCNRAVASDSYRY